ncbi:methyl-accepting chemotaxis protein [Halanaerocella petrolearia]
MQKSLEKEITFKIGLATIIILTLISTLTILDFREAQIREIKKEMKVIIEKNASTISQEHKQIISLVQTMADYQEAGGFGRREASLEFLHKFLENNHNIIAGGFGYEPNADGQDDKYAGNSSKAYNKQGRFLPYLSKSKDGFNLTTLVGLDASFYQNPKKTGKLTITEPYMYDGTMVVSFAAPIMIDGQFQGITGVDKTLSQIQKRLKRLKNFETSHYYLLSSNNKIVATSDEDELINKKINQVDKYKMSFNSLLGKEKGKIVKDSNLNKFVAYAPVKVGDWKLVITVAENEVLAEINKLTWKMIGLSVLGFLVLCGLLYWLIQRSLRPLNDLQQRIAEIAENGGDLTQRLEVKSNNEIGKLSKSFNKLLASLHNIMKNISDETENVASASEELSASAEEGNAVVETTTVNMEEMSSGIQQVSASSQSVNDFAQDTGRVAQEGRESINSAISQMEQISNKAEDSGDYMMVLDQKAEEIDKIIQLITNIAEQTNLLALNAAIEAARAGEHGQGFAVVADEIRQLAEESADATDKITNLIREIQENTDQALVVTKEADEEIAKGQKIIDQAGQSFEDIVEAIEETIVQIEETNAATQQLASGSDEVVNATDEINQIVDEVANSSTDLAANAEKLQEIVDQFKV